MLYSPTQLDWMLRGRFAHRGLHDAARAVPENSLAAFETAIRWGFGIELDVRACADGTPVVFHDTDLARMTGQVGSIYQTSGRDLARLRLGGTDQRIPTLTEALLAIDGRVPLLIEMKAGGKPGVTETGVRRALEGYGGPVAVMSFNADMLRWFRRYAPDVTRGLVLRCRKASTPLLAPPLRQWLRRREARPHFLAYDHRCLPNRTARWARRRKMPVLAWTVTSDAEMDRLEAHADSLIVETRPASQAAA